MNFTKVVLSCLHEGEGVEGFDLPIRYPLKPGHVFKRVIFPPSLRLGTPRIIWYVVSKVSYSDKWATLRAATAQLSRNGIKRNAISQNLYPFLSNYPSQVKTVSGQEIPDKEKNIIQL